MCSKPTVKVSYEKGTFRVMWYNTRDGGGNKVWDIPIVYDIPTAGSVVIPGFYINRIGWYLFNGV